MIRPCATCPWRKATRTCDIPGGGLSADLSRRMRDSMEETPFGSTVMQCHVADHACAGFVLKVRFDSVGLRLAAAWGLVDVDDYEDGGIEMWESFDAMLAAHGVEG